MKQDILYEFYNKHFNGIIPYRNDGRIRDYLTDMLPYYLKNLAMQEVAIIRSNDKSKNTDGKKNDEELLFTISKLKEELLMDNRSRCISRLNRKIKYNHLHVTLVDGVFESMIEEEMNLPDFQKLCYDLDFYKNQLSDYIDICEEHGIDVTMETDEAIVIKNRI